MFRSNYPDSAVFLKFLAFFDLTTTYSVFESTAESELLSRQLRGITKSSISFRHTMGKLIQFSIISTVATECESTYSLHPVVHAWCLEFLNAACDDSLFWQAAAILSFHPYAKFSSNVRHADQAKLELHILRKSP
jgi:hypothetical protein